MDSWLKKEQGSDSSNGSYKNEMYNVNENHIDKINTIRRQLKLLEILDDDEEPKTNTLDFDNISADSSESISYNPEKLNKSQRKRKYNSFKMTSENALGKDANIFSKTTESLQISLPTSNYSTLEYNTPKRKKLKVKRTPHFYKQLLGTQSTIDISPSNLENDKESVLGSTQIRYINRNFRRKNEIDDQCDNRNMEKPEDVHLEPNVKIMQGTSNENCLKFLPIKDRKIVFTEKPESRIFKDNLFNIDITFDEIAPPTIPICNNFLN
ncbi:hypothetical protein HHI36_016382 [Cryptolaemus montrouzieri]|uniref:Uncharacterized protein n=1 Tax=Cryptolaemus montrouzieri TaxID=559131 RepID=A0ABD2NKC0_9CUCU